MFNWIRSAAPAFLLVLAAGASFSAPAPRAGIAADAVVEAIVFEGIGMSEQRAIVDRIAVRVGDRLDAAARQRIGRRLNPPGDLRLFSYRDQGLTFSDRSGSTAGKVVLVIRPGC